MIKQLFFSIVLGALLFTSCSKDENADINIVYKTTVGQELLQHNATYNINSTDVQFTNVAYYVGDMSFTLSNSTSFTSQNRYQLITPGEFTYSFSLENVGEDEVDFNQASFFIGVDSLTNQQTEQEITDREEGDPLGFQNPSMHWGWTGGYKFMSIDGLADVDGDGEFETTLIYHLGFDDFLKDFSLDVNESIESGETNYKIIFDVDKFLSNVNFETENFTKVTPDSYDLALKLYNNYDNAVSISKI